MKKVIIKDYRNYDPDYCCNGGKYGFIHIYTEQKDGSFEVEHYTTSDIDYCSKCGTFGHMFWECDFNRKYTADEVKEYLDFLRDIPGIEIFEANIKKYQVSFTDFETGATSEIDIIMVAEGYTAEDYVKDCMENADEEWSDMLKKGNVILQEIEEE